MLARHKHKKVISNRVAQQSRQTLTSFLAHRQGLYYQKPPYTSDRVTDPAPHVATRNQGLVYCFEETPYMRSS